MKITRKQLIENAGIFKEGSSDRDAIAHFVWGRDEFMEKSEQEIERLIDELEKEYNASKQNYSTVEDYIEELEQSGGLEGMMEEGVLNEASRDAWPIGYFEVVNSFKITPGGGWYVSFNKGDILKVEDATKDGYPGIQKITKWDALKNDWIPKRPPISGMEVFPISKFGGSYNWVNLFTQNTKTLSKAAAESKTKSMAKETVLSVRDAIKMLNGLSQTAQVKITII